MNNHDLIVPATVGLNFQLGLRKTGKNPLMEELFS